MNFFRRLKFLSSCMQLYLQSIQTDKPGVGQTETAKKAEATRRVAANIKTLMLDLFHNPPSFKSAVHYSWKKEAATPEAVRSDG